MINYIFPGCSQGCGSTQSTSSLPLKKIIKMKLRITLMHKSLCFKLESKRVIYKCYYFTSKYNLKVTNCVGHILQLNEKYQCSIKLFLKPLIQIITPQILLVKLALQIRILKGLLQKLATFFCKEPNSKYFWFCGLYGSPPPLLDFAFAV